MERVDVSPRQDSYWSLLSELWAAGESFLLIEEDIEVDRAAVEAMRVCPESWCAASYGGPGGGLLRRCLGFTRFSLSLLWAHPGLMGEVGAIKDSSEVVAGGWRRLDARTDGALRQAGVEVHEHAPVLHHHVYDGVCVCGLEHEPYPVDQEGRYLAPGSRV